MSAFPCQHHSNERTGHQDDGWMVRKKGPDRWSGGAFTTEPSQIVKQFPIHQSSFRLHSRTACAFSRVVFGAILWSAAVAAVGFAQDPSEDDRALSHLFGDDLARNALEVHRISRQMPVQQRYEYLKRQVLPAYSNEIRLSVDYLPTNPSPPVIEKYGAGDLPFGFQLTGNRRPSGGVLVSPAIELVKSAERLGKLGALRTNVARRVPTDAEQVKARLALEILLDWADNAAPAGETLTELISLARAPEVADPERVPELIVATAAFQVPERLEQCSELIYLLYLQTQAYDNPHSVRFQRAISSLKFLADLHQQNPQTAPRGPAELSLARWNRVTRCTAFTRGQGFPAAMWTAGEHSANKVTCHDDDYLYFSIPLRGEYEIEADLTAFGYQEIRLMVGGYWAGPRYTLSDCQRGTFREEFPSIPINPPLSHMSKRTDRMRVQAAVGEGACVFTFDGRKVWTQPLRPDADPWVALQCSWFTHGSAENLRITGRPEVPDEIDLIASSDLPGWLPYFSESAGGPATDWRLVGSGGSRELIGRSYSGRRGSDQESLLRYHRPMLEDGTIEYEFFYQEGESAVYPALDRCCFLFDRDRAGIHWITDGPYDRTGLDPANFTRSQTVQTIPLIENDWNRVRLTLTGDDVEISLNGEAVLTRKLEPGNQRTFGLFHYADRTAARARNLRWRGEWPKKLPPLAGQQLADLSLEDELADGPELPVVFEHDFSAGVSADKIYGGINHGWEQHVEQVPDGVRITRGGGYYQSYGLSLPIELEGDFDVTAEFADFQSATAAPGEGSIRLQIGFEDEQASVCRLYRKQQRSPAGTYQQTCQTATFQRLETNTGQEWTHHVAEESTSGRLRFVRRRGNLFFLYASDNSSQYRLIHRREITTAPVSFAGMRLVVETNNEGESSVTWKNVTVRAQNPTQWQKRAAVTVADLDERRGELPVSVQYPFNRKTPVDGLRTWGGEDRLRKENDSWVMTAPGSKTWTTSGFASQSRLAGDYDVTLNLELLKLAAAESGGRSFVMLKTQCSLTFPGYAEFKLFNSQPGGRELVIQRSMFPPDGSNRLEMIKVRRLEKVTQLRLARRGGILYFVYRPAENAPQEIFGHMQVGNQDVLPDRLMTMLYCGVEGEETAVRLKSMSIRAEQIIEP